MSVSLQLYADAI